jgi:hypothetical protein
LASMIIRLLLLCLLLSSTAQAAVLRVSAEAPLSAERLADAIRSYVDGADVEVSPTGRSEGRDGSPTPPGVVEIWLRRHGDAAEDAELVLMDGEETTLNRLPGALRIEDLYRTAALKVQSVLQRQKLAASAAANLPSEVVGERAVATNHGGEPDRFLLDAGLALLVPSAGRAREGLRLGAGLRFARVWHLSLGAYLEPEQSTGTDGIDVSEWELPIALRFGRDWHEGAWSGWLDVVGQAAVSRISAEAPEIVSNSSWALSPRAGLGIGFGVPVGQGLRAEIHLSLLAVLADRRYLVDGQVVRPPASALGLVEMGLAYGRR